MVNSVTRAVAISRGSCHPGIAAEGEFAGWHLDWSSDEEELTFKGNTYLIRRLVLDGEAH